MASPPPGNSCDCSTRTLLVKALLAFIHHPSHRLLIIMWHLQDLEGYGIPMALDLTLSHTDGLHPDLAMSRNRRHAYDARTHTVGPMPPAAFINTFFPQEDDKRGKLMTFNNAFKAVPRTADTPAAIYKPLVRPLSPISVW